MLALANLQYNAWQGREIFFSPSPDQPAIQGAIPLGVKCLGCEADHPPPSSDTLIRVSGDVLPLLRMPSKLWCLIKHSNVYML